MSQSQSVESLQPRAVWKFFSGIAAVPRPSKREEKIRAHLLEVVKGLQLDAEEDTTGNIVVRVPASPGCENAPTTVIQGHLDMVCEKNVATEHDFDRDPIRLIIDEEGGEPIVRADGTTLGADNGIGVSMALAAASSDEVTHGPLELLFTIDEETGMTGAKALTPQSFTGRQLINLDSEEDDSLYIGCAGGRDTNLIWSFTATAIEPGWVACRVSVSGLRGGHSGCDIHENRGNAIQLLTRALDGADVDLRLGSIQGGSMRNAIPREADAVVALPADRLDALRRCVTSVEIAGRAESYEDDLSMRVDELSETESLSLLSVEDSSRLLGACVSIPSGVIAMHPKIGGLVQTSNNLSTISTESDASTIRVRMGNLSRSSLESAVDMVSGKLQAIAKLSGGESTQGNDYPGWEPDVDSKLLELTRKLYEKEFGAEPNVAAIHAGLECGIIGSRVGRMDMISFGPRIEGAHSPDERVYIRSVQKSWGFLVAVLGAIAQP